MRIDSSGNVGIGTTTPGTLLQVNGDITAALGGNVADAGGALQFRNGSLSTYSPMSQVKGVLTNSAGTELQGGISFSTRPLGAAGQVMTERMRITDTGNVGIGTSSPSARLNVVGTNEFTLGFLAQTSSTQTPITNHPVALLYNSSTAAGNGAGLRYQIADTTGNGQTAGGTGMVATAKTSSTVTADMYFYTGTSERMRITSAGNVGIGTTAPGYKLDVNGTGYFNSSVQFFSQDGFRFTSASAVSAMRFGSAFTGESTAEWAYDRAAGAITLSQGATGSALNERMRITSAGNVGIGTTGPGYRLDIASGDTSAGLGYAMRIRSNATATAATIQFTNSAVSAQNGTITCTDAGVMVLQSDGASSLLAFRTNGNERFRILSTGGITSGDLADAVGYKGVPQNSQTASYTLALSDMGKHISITTGGVVIPANSSVAFPIGSTITIYNNSASAQNISITTDTLRLAGTATSGTRSLAQRGLATCIKVAATEWVVTGNVT
jgi:hypothetical protein